MDNQRVLTEPPVAKAEMLIRKPVAEVFEAFINPEVTRKFWFTKSTGPLAPGEKVTWTWEMYGVSTEVEVKEIEANKRILIEWSGYGSPETVEWTFTAYEGGATFVSIVNSGFTGSGDELAQKALDSTGGFTMVLAGLKALLEHGIQLNLVADRFPKRTHLSAGSGTTAKASCPSFAPVDTIGVVGRRLRR
jgi:uncharacterized protein YndB with AHSA1/START domain